MRSKLMTLLKLVEAGELELAQDFVTDAREEVHTLLEFGNPIESDLKSRGEQLDKAVYEYFRAKYNGDIVTGFIVLAEMAGKTGSGRDLRWICVDSMMNDHTRIGALQMFTSDQMDSYLN